jgi:TfoX/Sxy family transcriptional regulator of competence genes
MSFDETLTDRVREALGPRRGLTERKMFGGLAFMLRGNMCCGVLKRELIVRVPPDETDDLLAEPHTRAFDFTGRPMRGFVVIRPAGCEHDGTLADWVDRAVAFAATLPAK